MKSSITSSSAFRIAVYCTAAFLISACARKTVLQGRVVVAQQKLPYLAHQKLSLERNLRTTHTTEIDGFGFFEFRKVKARRSYVIRFDSVPKALEGSVFYLADLNGKKIKEIDLRSGFEYRLLDVEVDLLAVEDDDLDQKIRQFKKGLAGNEMLVRKYIHYELGSYLITKENRSYMNAITHVLKENPQFLLKVNSHADAIGNDEYNLALSLKRANEIKAYLVKKGISPDRILTYGYGETRPVNQCINGVNCSELQHRQNRRTEFVFKVKKEGAISVRG